MLAHPVFLGWCLLPFFPFSCNSDMNFMKAKCLLLCCALSSLCSKASLKVSVFLLASLEAVEEEAPVTGFLSEELYMVNLLYIIEKV